jgi:hypothetical protein
MSTSPILPAPPTSGTTPTSASPLPSSQSLNNMFLQLLVAQLQNQDPLSPLDPSQFVGQLAQFSELSEVTSIYQLLQQGVVAPGGSGSGGSGSGGSSGGASPVGGASSPTANSAILQSAVSSAPAAVSNFASPSLSALANTVQGVF